MAPHQPSTICPLRSAAKCNHFRRKFHPPIPMLHFSSQAMQTQAFQPWAHPIPSTHFSQHHIRQHCTLWPRLPNTEFLQCTHSHWVSTPSVSPRIPPASTPQSATSRSSSRTSPPSFRTLRHLRQPPTCHLPRRL
ncbi:hypothetical protein VIGAN_09222400 [Vigna angularis var. angularis]|uniref:Uncharacterized protein n=1 Tax=Vigna angularis var. angularis TaxID=157739 RepID=A0A0S3T136_PHAAN|nr:hypothetical protein VIGAN_09222400 [Vigna angularis var. angularis]